VSLHSDASPLSEHTHTPSASHGSEASSPSPHHVDLPPFSCYLGTLPSEHLDVSPSPHDSDALSFSPLLGMSHHIVHSPANKIFDEAPGMMLSSWRSSQESPVQPSSQSPSWEETRQHDSSFLQPPAPRSIVSDTLSILKHYNDSTDPVERELLGQIVEMVRKNEARYSHPPPHTQMLQRHTRVQSKGISDELVAYAVPPIVRLPSTPQHNARSRTERDTPAQVAKIPCIFERLPPRPRRSSPSNIPRPVRSSSSRMHSPTRLGLHTPTSEARTASIENAFAYVAAPRRQHPLQSTVAKYAGPTFTTSPSPSALPIPKFPPKSKRARSSLPPLCIVNGGPQFLDGQRLLLKPGPSANIRQPPSDPKANVVKSLREEILSFQCRSVPTRPPTPPLNNPSFDYKWPGGQGPLRKSKSLNNMRQPIEASRGAQPNVVKTADGMVVGSTQITTRALNTVTSTNALDNRKTLEEDTTETATKKSDTPATLEPPIARAAPQNILPQPSSCPTTPIALGPLSVMRNKSNARTRPDTPRPQTVRPPTNQSHRPPPIPINRPPWLDLTDEEFEATRPVVEEPGDRVVNLVKWREFQEWLGRKCMRGLEKFERERGDERGR
jgi:hypothetical protein